MIKDKSIETFLDELAGKAPTPGGGSAAAIMGAMSAALVSMVCNLTIGKKKYEGVEGELQALLVEAEGLRNTLIGLVKADVDAFERVMAAYRMPKDDENQRLMRHTEIQEALKVATDVPLECARACAKAIDLSRIAAEKGNLNVVSDAGVAVLAGYAALKSAALNVYVNVGSIEDESFVTQRSTELEQLLRGNDVASEEIYQTVKNKL